MIVSDCSSAWPRVRAKIVHGEHCAPGSIPLLRRDAANIREYADDSLERIE